MSPAKLLILFIVFLASSALALQNAPNKAEIQQIFLTGLEYYNAKEYIKAVKEWDKIIDNYGYIDSKLKGYYTKAYNKILIKQRLVIKGLDYYKQKNFAEAIVVFNSVLEEAPYDTTSHEYIAKAQNQLEKINTANLIKSRTEEGDKLYQEKEYLQALEKYRTVLILDPENQPVMDRVRLLKDLIDEQNRLVEIDQHLEKGRSYLVSRDPDPAIEEFNYVLGIQQDHQEAKELLLEASKLKNELSQQQHIESMISNAVALFHQEKYSEALAVFNDILEIRPDEPTSLEYKTKIAAYYDSLKQQEAFNSQLDGFYSQAMVSYNARNYLKSRENFMNVFSLNSNYLEVKKYLALIQMRLSEEQARKIQEQQDKIVEYLDNGIAYYQVADYKNAIFDLSKCLELDPQNTFAKEYLDKAKEALFAKSQEDIDDDSPYYEIVIKLYRDAIAFYNAGEYQRSMTYLEKILLLFPNNKNTRDLLIKITLKVDPAKTEAFLQNHYNTGVDLYKNKEYPNSLKEFNLINSIRSNYKNIAEYIGKIDEKLNPETLSIPLPVLKESFDKGLVYYSEGKFDMAKREWEKVIQDNSDRNIYRVKAIINLNKINLKNKFNADTTPVVEQGAMSDKDIRVNQYYLKGVSLYVNGDYAQALQEWESGLKIDPNNRKLINSANKCRIKLEVQKTQKE